MPSRSHPPRRAPAPAHTCACTLALWSAVSLVRAARSLASASSRARALAAAVWLSSCSVPRGACSGGYGRVWRYACQAVAGHKPPGTADNRMARATLWGCAHRRKQQHFR